MCLEVSGCFYNNLCSSVLSILKSDFYEFCFMGGDYMRKDPDITKEPDITLERILSLIPKKPDGNYVHGEKKKFAKSIGYESGDVVSMWINGSSFSYRGKIHEISAKYNVSVEWLEGKSDIKEQPTRNTDEPEDEETIEMRQIWARSTQEERNLLISAARALEAIRNNKS